MIFQLLSQKIQASVQSCEAKYKISRKICTTARKSVTNDNF